MKRGPYKKKQNHKVSPACVPAFVDPDKYVDDKVKMLEEEFMIKISYDDTVYLRQYKTENEINAAVKGLINKYWK